MYLGSSTQQISPPPGVCNFLALVTSSKQSLFSLKGHE